MEVFWWILGITLLLLLAVLGVTYVCFRMTFYISDKEKKENALRIVPPGRAYEPFHDMISNDIDLLIAGELSEWHCAEPVRDMAQMGMQKSIIILGHAASEMDAMDDFAKYINNTFLKDGITAKYFECGEIYSYID